MDQIRPNAPAREPSDPRSDSRADPRADVRAHVEQVRRWTPQEASRQAQADVAAYQTQRGAGLSEAPITRLLREDIALRARNNDPYRAHLLRHDPQTLREALTQPIVSSRADRGDSRGAEADTTRTAVGVVTALGALDTGARDTGAHDTARAGAPQPDSIARARQAALSGIAANDEQAQFKRELIDRLTPEELKRYAGADRVDPTASERVLREAAAREAASLATAPKREAAPPLDERFNVSRRLLLTTQYEFRDRPGTVAFTERWNTLRTTQPAPAAAIAMIDRAGERGWAAVRVSGSAEFMRQAWIAAEARGIKAVGYEPTKVDIDAARQERERLAREATARERATGAARDQAALAGRGAPSERTVPTTTAAGATARDSSAREADAKTAPHPSVERQEQDRHAANSAERARELAPGMRGDASREPSRARQVEHGSGSTAFMRALEQVMERYNVPQSLRPEIRTVAERQFAALRADNKTVRVRVVDRAAARRTPVQLPHYEVKRASQERTR